VRCPPHWLPMSPHCRMTAATAWGSCFAPTDILDISVMTEISATTQRMSTPPAHTAEGRRRSSPPRRAQAPTAVLEPAGVTNPGIAYRLARLRRYCEKLKEERVVPVS